MVAKGRSKTPSARKHTTITIPRKLYEKLETMIEDTGFASVSSYVTFVMREIVASQLSEKEEPFTREDEERVKKRLRALGYID